MLLELTIPTRANLQVTPVYMERKFWLKCVNIAASRQTGPPSLPGTLMASHEQYRDMFCFRNIRNTYPL